MIRLLIKGSMYDAISAATKKDISLENIVEVRSKYGTITEAQINYDQAFVSIVSKWFTNSINSGNKGSLLHYKLPEKLT